MKTQLRLFFLFIFCVSPFFTSAQFKMEKKWGQNFKNSLNSINKANNLLVDRQGNCYVLGTTAQTDSAKDIILIKYTSAGTEEWARTYNNPNNGDDIPYAMCLDTEGNVWVCGMARLSTSNADFLVVKFTPDGIPLNENIHDGPEHLFDCATSITSDGRGGVYVAGYETASDSGINLAIFRCRSDASFAWKRTYATKEMDIANQIITDDSSNVYVCGTSNSGLHKADILVQKYNYFGDKKWQLIYDGVLSQSDFGQYISADDSMNIYVSGFINHSNSRADIPVFKLDRGGELKQESYYNGRIAECVAVDLEPTRNNVYLTGGCVDYNISESNTFIVCFNKAGKVRYLLTAPIDVRFFMTREVGGRTTIFGSKTTHPESTLIPYVAVVESDSIVWSFSDNEAYGLSHIVSAVKKGNDIYFLGDDTGEATGSISVFKYELKPDPGYHKPVKKKRK